MTNTTGGIRFGQSFAVPSPVTPRDPGFHDDYANQVRVSVAVTDVNLIFSAMNDRGPGIFVMEDRASVRMSPITAKVLLLNLQMVIDAYETAIGKIIVPPKVEKQIRDHRAGLQNMLVNEMTPPEGETPSTA